MDQPVRIHFFLGEIDGCLLIAGELEPIAPAEWQASAGLVEMAGSPPPPFDAVTYMKLGPARVTSLGKRRGPNAIHPESERDGG